MTMSKEPDIREELFFQPKNGYDCIDREERILIEEYAEKYKAFLDKARTEREAVKLSIRMAEEAGFVE